MQINKFQLWHKIKNQSKAPAPRKTSSLAYLSESAYSRYTYYAQQAVKESYFPVSEIFNETAANELHHAKVFFKMLEGGHITVEIGADAGVIGTTAENLATAIAEEALRRRRAVQTRRRSGPRRRLRRNRRAFRGYRHRRTPPYDAFRTLSQNGKRRHPLET